MTTSTRTSAVSRSRTTASRSSSSPGGGSTTTRSARDVDLGDHLGDERHQRPRRRPGARPPARPGRAGAARRATSPTDGHRRSTTREPDELVVVPLVVLVGRSSGSTSTSSRRAAQRLGLAVRSSTPANRTQQPAAVPPRPVPTVSGPRSGGSVSRTAPGAKRVSGSSVRTSTADLTAGRRARGRPGRRPAASALVSARSSTSTKSMRTAAPPGSARRSRCAAPWRCGRRARSPCRGRRGARGPRGPGRGAACARAPSTSSGCSTMPLTRCSSASSSIRRSRCGPRRSSAPRSRQPRLRRPRRRQPPRPRLGDGLGSAASATGSAAVSAAGASAAASAASALPRRPAASPGAALAAALLGSRRGRLALRLVGGLLRGGLEDGLLVRLRGRGPQRALGAGQPLGRLPVAGDLEDRGDGLGRLRADAEPVPRPLGVDLDERGILLRVVLADLLDRAAVALGARVGDDDPVLRVAHLAEALELDLDCHGRDSPGCRRVRSVSPRGGAGAGTSVDAARCGERGLRPATFGRPVCQSPHPRAKRRRSGRREQAPSARRGARTTPSRRPARPSAASVRRARPPRAPARTRLAGLPLPRLGFLPCLACRLGLPRPGPMPAPPMPGGIPGSDGRPPLPIDCIILRASSNRSTSPLTSDTSVPEPRGDAGPTRAVEDLRVASLRRRHRLDDRRRPGRSRARRCSRSARACRPCPGSIPSSLVSEPILPYRLHLGQEVLEGEVAAADELGGHRLGLRRGRTPSRPARSA